MYQKEKRKRDKFDNAILGIFICSIIVSFSHTIELYESAGFDVPIEWMNNSYTERFLGKGFINLALFATLAAETAFSIGLWGLYEAFRVEHKFPGLRYKWTWGMFFGGLVIVGWSNIGGTLGYSYLFGNPIKGFVLGLSIPYFVLNAVLVNFSRTYRDEKEETVVNEQPKWKQWINTCKEIKSEIATLVESNKPEQEQSPNTERQSEQPERTLTEQIEIERDEQSNSEQREQHQHTTEQNKRKEIEQYNSEQTETEQRKQHSTEQNKHEEIEQPKTKEKQGVSFDRTDRRNIEQTDDETETSAEQNKKPNRGKNRTTLYVVKSNNETANKTSKTEQAFQYVMEMIEQNKEYTVRSVAEAVGCAPSTALTAIKRAKANNRVEANS